jgi:hypothetical protein
MTTALSTTYTALKASISRKELAELRIFEKVKFKLYKAREDKKFLTTCCNNGIIPNFIKLKFSKFYKFKTYTIQYSLLKKEIKFKNSQIFQLNSQINKLNGRLFNLFRSHDHLDVLLNWRKFLENSLAVKINKIIVIQNNNSKG